jgi:hypothetical protein
VRSLHECFVKVSQLALEFVVFAMCPRSFEN